MRRPNRFPIKAPNTNPTNIPKPGIALKAAPIARPMYWPKALEAKDEAAVPITLAPAAVVSPPIPAPMELKTTDA
ncbi:hypothetical protein D3C71_1079390 [compost metagenome]